MAWASSTRRARLPKDWPTRVATVRRTAKGRCQAQVHVPDCDGVGTDCDHVVAGDDHSLTNLQWLSLACHKAKTQADKPHRRRPTRAHPGHVTSPPT